MAKKKKDRTTELPGMTGHGIESVKIAEIDKAVNRYERKKEEWTRTSPGVIDAKRELRTLLHEHREKLPVNGDGEPFYRHDGVDYTLKETLTRSEADDGETREAI